MNHLKRFYRRLQFAALAMVSLYCGVAEAQDLVWAKALGGGGMDLAYRVAIDTAGNVYTVGAFQLTADFNPGPAVFAMTSAGGEDIYVSKLDSAGNFVWAKRIGGASNERALGLALDRDNNIYLTGFFEGVVDFDPGAGSFSMTALTSQDAFVAELDSDGNFIWAKKVSTIDDSSGQDVQVDDSGNVYVTGLLRGVGDFDPAPGNSEFILTTKGSLDGFILKLDSSGAFVWAKQFGGTGSDLVYSLAVDGNGAVYATGYFNAVADFDPGAGVVNLASAGAADIFVVRLDSNGTFAWARRLGGPESDGAQRIALDSLGNIYVAGGFRGTADFNPGTGTFALTAVGSGDAYVTKLDSAGNFIWARAFGGPGLDATTEVAADSSGNVYAAGYFEATADLDPGPSSLPFTALGSVDAFVSKMDSAGTFLWAQQMGGIGFDAVLDVVLDNQGNFVAGGQFAGVADLAPGSSVFNLTGFAASDVFVAKYADPSGGGQEPVISEGGVVLATLLPKVTSVSPLAIISVFGEHFTDETILFPNLDSEGRLARILGGVCLEMNGERLPIFAVTPGQINAQASAQQAFGPAAFSVIANCDTANQLTSEAVKISLASNVETAMVEQASPGFFLFSPLAVDGLIAARFNADAVAVAPVGMFTDQYGTSRPAMPGDIIVLYGTGWGGTEADLELGELAAGAGKLLLEANPMVSFGGAILAEEDVLYVGVSPQTAGLYQLAIRVPATVSPGDNPVTLTVYGKSTPVGPVIPVAAP